LSGEGVIAVDVRSPAEWASGHLPGAILLPATIANSQLSTIPPGAQDLTIVVYDAVGAPDGPADRVAGQLRANGHRLARMLVGGFAEWVEEGEETQVLEPVDSLPFQIADSVRCPDGSSGTVWGIQRTEREPLYQILVHTDGDHVISVPASEIH